LTASPVVEFTFKVVVPVVILPVVAPPLSVPCVPLPVSLQPLEDPTTGLGFLTISPFIYVPTVGIAVDSYTPLINKGAEPPLKTFVTIPE
jgi:hypothetical protein